MKKSVFLLVSFVAFSMAGCVSAEPRDTQYSSEINTESNISDVSGEAYNFQADITHDGIDEDIKVTTDNDGLVVTLAVYSGKDIVFEDELYVHAALGSQYYLVKYADKSYFMRYTPLVDHDMATCEYEVFRLTQSSEKVDLDTDQIEISLYNVKSMDQDAWSSFAQKENVYFKNATLLVSTSNGEIEFGDPDVPKEYEETFSWMLWSGQTDTNDVKQNLGLFIDGALDSYSE